MSPAQCNYKTMNRLIKRDSNRGRYALLDNDWNNNRDLEHASRGSGAMSGAGDDPRLDKRYIAGGGVLLIRPKVLAIGGIMVMMMMITI